MNCKKDYLKTAGPVKIIKMLFAGVTIAALFAFIFGKLVQFLWNVTIADIFNLQDISYWQAVGILLLSRILVGGMGQCKNGNGDHWHKHGHEMLERKLRCREKSSEDEPK